MAEIKKVFAHQRFILPFKEKSGAAFSKGDLVTQDSSTGYIDICGADETQILGIAQRTKAGTTATEILVDVILPGDLVEIPFSTTTAQTGIGKSYGCVFTTTAQTIDQTDTTNTRVNILEFNPKDAVGTSGGRCWVTFIPKYLIAGGNNEA